MRILHSKITAAGLVGICVWLALSVVVVQIRRSNQVRDLRELQDRVQAGQRENERLAGQLERMKEPAWLTLLARNRLNYKNPDETVVFVYKSEKSGTIGQPQQPIGDVPNWKKWWQWLRGR